MSTWGVSERATTDERLDQALMREPFNLSRRAAKRAMESGTVVVEGNVMAVASRRIPSGTRISIIDANASLPVLHLARAFVVIDKPARLPSQIPADTNAISAHEVLAAQMRRAGDRRTVKIVHRLDTNTTGAMIYALGDAAAARIAGKMQTRSSSKTYLALVSGTVSEEILIDAPIARTGAREFGVRTDGRPARTNITPLATGEGATLVKAELLTGRTHQIRIHCTHAGFPILGDRKYGGAVAEQGPRPMLHSWKLSVEGEGAWEAAVPPDFRAALAEAGIAWAGA